MSSYVPHHVVCYFQVKQSQDHSGDLSELQNLKEQLEKSEEERKALESQLSQTNAAVTQFQEKGSC